MIIKVHYFAILPLWTLLTLAQYPIPHSEFFALIDFYQATNGDYWHNNSGWEFATNYNTTTTLSWDTTQLNFDTINTSSTDYNNISFAHGICSQYVPYGLTCSLETSYNSNYTNYNYSDNYTLYHIISIDFQNNNLDGTIPDSISNLTYLEIFLIYNEFSLYGTVPRTMFTNLAFIYYFVIRTTLDFNYNDLICNWKLLETLSISTNGTNSGYIPDCITNLQSLTFIQLDPFFPWITNQSIPAGFFTDMPNIETFSINGMDYMDESLYPTLPNYFNMPNLTWFSYRNLHLHGTIPDNICNIGSNKNILDYFNMRYNSLTGSIPQCLFEMIINPGFVDGFGLNNNQLTGTIADIDISSSIASINNNITDINCEMAFLTLQNNHLTGTIPDWMSYCTYSEIVDLGDNNLHGTLPSGWKAKKLAFNNNYLSGTIPINFMKIMISGKGWIDLADNYLTGIIPLEVVNHSNIRDLHLEGNLFTYFPFEQVLSNSLLPSLSTFAISDNEITSNSYTIDQILNGLFRMSNDIEIVLLDSNLLTGDISQWTIFNNENNYLKALTLHNNDIYGELPSGIKMNNIEYFTVFNNRLSCEIPQGFLDNSNNQLLYGIGLLGNLFTKLDDDNYKDWMFNEALNLYLTEFDQFLQVGCVIATAFCAVVLFVTTIAAWIKIYKKNRGDSYNRNSSKNSDNINNHDAERDGNRYLRDLELEAAHATKWNEIAYFDLNIGPRFLLGWTVVCANLMHFFFYFSCFSCCSILWVSQFVVEKTMLTFFPGCLNFK